MGTGLGLATALRLAQEMDGELELASQAAQGFATEFVLRLRAASTPASAASTRVRS
jgi:signal transduction histidine kinase